MAMVVFRDNDNIIEFDFDGGNFLKDATTGSAVAAATVSMVIVDGSGNVLLASTSMAAVPGESGNYRGNVPDTLDLSAFDEVFAEVTADNGTNAKGFWTRRLIVSDRT